MPAEFPDAATPRARVIDPTDYVREKDRPTARPAFPQLSGRHEAVAKLLRCLHVKTPRSLAAAGNYSYPEAARLMEEIEYQLSRAG